MASEVQWAVEEEVVGDIARFGIGCTRSCVVVIISFGIWVFALGIVIFDFVFCERLDHGGKETIALREAD